MTAIDAGRAADIVTIAAVRATRLPPERLYSTATILASPRTAATTGEFADLSELTGLKTFITSFAGHIAAEAAR